MVQIETLPNGVRLVTEAMDTVRSAALGIWVGGGSREETPEESGAAHFIEHMLFKGTQRRTAQDIARETDAIGGQMNAFTTKECTCFYGRVLDDHLPQALDILFDMVYCSSFAQEAVETERGVILEEIDMYEDTPDDLCAEKLFGAVFAGSPLARPILGREETLAPMTGAFLKAYHDAHYRGDNTVVALTGSFSQEVLEDIRRRFSALPAGRAPAPVPAAYTPAFVATPKPIEQNHLTLAFPGLDYNSPKRFALQLLSAILGGGVSSRRGPCGDGGLLYLHGPEQGDGGQGPGDHPPGHRRLPGQGPHHRGAGAGQRAVEGQRHHGPGIHPVPYEPRRAVAALFRGNFDPGADHRRLRPCHTGGRGGPGAGDLCLGQGVPVCRGPSADGGGVPAVGAGIS